ncbi:MAG: glycosyltransferase [Pseudomonadota bacterium]
MTAELGLAIIETPFRVFIGWDSREQDAYEVAAHSLQRHASIPVIVTPIKQEELRAQGLYRRDRDPLASTEFTYTRFFTPHLAGFEGYALFHDCDFLWTGDIAELLAIADPSKAVSCVQHDHRPPEELKMEGAVQTRYPRKNWSSLMLFNCAHPATRRLDVAAVNEETGAYLHRMQWAADDEIGALPETWNWLEGWNKVAPGETPKVIHYTRGGPWFEQWRDVEFAELWREELARVNSGAGHPE